VTKQCLVICASSLYQDVRPLSLHDLVNNEQFIAIKNDLKKLSELEDKIKYGKYVPTSEDLKEVFCIGKNFEVIFKE
jgi:hypothetical protein